MKGSYRRIGLIVALAMLSSLALASVAGAHHGTPPTPPSPSDPSGTGCGQVIITSTIMTHDVGPCPGDGIIIAANNITLDMAGHTITGGNLVGTTSDPVNCCTPGNAGVKFVNVTGSTVKNGTIRLFNAGVAIEGGSTSNTYGSGNTVDNVTAELNLGSLLTDYGEGVNIHNSDGNTVKNSRVGTSDTTLSPLTVGVGNGPYSGISLLGDSDFNKLGVAGAGNFVEVNIEPSGTSNQDDGIRLEPNYGVTPVTVPDNNEIVGNTVTNNSLDGISLLAGPSGGVTGGNTIRANLVRRNGVHTFAHRKGDGIRVFANNNGNTIGGPAAGDGNTVTGNAASGIRVDSSSNTIQNNTARLNCAVPDPQRLCVGSPLLIPPALAQGADLFEPGAKTAPCNNTWTANTYGTKNKDCIS